MKMTETECNEEVYRTYINSGTVSEMAADTS